MSKKLSKESEDRIMNALEKAAGYVNDGDSPTDAIVKAAEEYKIPLGHIELMTNAYNTSRTNIQRKNGNDIFEKAGEFELADPDKVKEMLFPSKYKTKEAAHRVAAVSNEYEMSPVWMERWQKPRTQEKTATVKLVDKKPEPYPTEVNNFKKAQDEIKTNKQKLAEFRRLKQAMADSINTTYADLINYFKTPGHAAYTTVKENASIIFGDKAAGVLEHVIKAFPHAEKQASTRNWQVATKASAPYNLINKILVKTAEFLQVSDKFAQAEKAVADLEVRLLRPFSKTSEVIPSVIDGDQFWTKASDSVVGSMLGKGVDILSGHDIVKNVAKEVPGITPTDSMLKSDMSKLVDPEHENALRQIEAEAALHDLLANDEIISSHKPEDVVRIYNELNQIAPRAVTHKMLLRAALRKRLAYGGDQVDPIDVDQLLGIEDKLKKRDDMMAHPGSHGLTPLGNIPAPPKKE